MLMHQMNATAHTLTQTGLTLAIVDSLNGITPLLCTDQLVLWCDYWLHRRPRTQTKVKKIVHISLYMYILFMLTLQPRAKLFASQTTFMWNVLCLTDL